jgi:hypothetical protein
MQYFRRAAAGRLLARENEVIPFEIEARSGDFRLKGRKNAGLYFPFFFQQIKYNQIARPAGMVFLR